MSRRGVKEILREILPWFVALGLVSYLLYRIPIHELTAALKRTSIWGMLAIVIFVDVGALITDSWATSRVLTWFLVPVGFVELIPVRAATYIVAIINYSLGQASLIYYVHRVKKVPLLPITGLVLMMMGTVLLILCAMSVSAVLLAPDDRSKNFAMLLITMGGGAVFYFFLLWLRPQRLTAIKLFQPLFAAGISGHFKATLVRIPHICIVVLTHIVGMRLFAVDVPVAAGLVFIPLVLLVGTIPVTPFGLGTQQWAAVYFFAPYAPGRTKQAREAVVLAYSLALASLALLLQALMGLVCLKKVSKLIRKPEEGDGEEGS